jgi:DNA helicase-2/ATP-dependent DNA helicase PcrA
MPSPNNRLLISVAGSGKTTYLIHEALKIRDSQVVITTYTEANEMEIRRKFMEINRSIPGNITIQTWFSFLIQHGVKPYQGAIFRGEINGMILVSGQSGIKFKTKAGIPIPYAEGKDFINHYFSPSGKLYSDKLSKFVIRCNTSTDGQVVDRLSRIYSHIFIDEVQDLAGNDLEIIALLFKSEMKVTLVGDPRQVTYLTHNEKLNGKYKDGNIRDFIFERCKSDCAVDETTLKFSHRNNAEICQFSSRLYPDLPVSLPCSCESCRTVQSGHTGVFLIRPGDVDLYRSQYQPTVLRYQLAVPPEWNYGNCKGLGFERILIYPTSPISTYLRNGKLEKVEKGKTKRAFDIAKLYVAITRAKYSVGFVYDYSNETFIEGIKQWP